jgi:hypothetical protein
MALTALNLSTSTLGAPVSAQANFGMAEVKSRSDGRSQNHQPMRICTMKNETNPPLASVQANLRQQVKSLSDGRSQNRCVMRGRKA